MNVNSLDARAFSARGGLGDGLADVIRAIAGGYLQNQDRADARLDRQATLSAELRRRNEDIGRQDRIRSEDIQRQDARYAVTDADRAWQRDHTESQDAATQAERDRVAGRQGLADALEQAGKYGVVPQRPDFVTAPTEREQAVWGAANRGAEDRSLSAELKRAQVDAANTKGLATLMGTGKGSAGSKGPTSAVLKAVHALAEAEAVSSGAAGYNELNGNLEIKDPASWRDILRQSYKAHGVEIPDVPTPIKPIEQIDPASLSDEEAMARGFTVYRDGLRNGQPAPVAATAASPVPATAAAAPVARPAAPSMTLGQVMAAAPWATGLPPQVVARIAAGRGINLVPDRADMIAPQQNAPANTAAMR